jgi:hypothetical protein
MLDEMKERLRQVDENLLQTRANYNALEGSKQELLHWIGKLEEAIKATD